MAKVTKMPNAHPAESDSPRWLEWAREIQALSQTGLTYSEEDYLEDRNRPAVFE